MAHSQEHTRAMVNRLSRAIGHLESIRDMVEQDRDCCEVLTQLAAVRSAIHNVGREILREHLHHCVADAVENGDRQALDDLDAAIGRFLK